MVEYLFVGPDSEDPIEEIDEDSRVLFVVTCPLPLGRNLYCLFGILTSTEKLYRGVSISTGEGTSIEVDITVDESAVITEVQEASNTEIESILSANLVERKFKFAAKASYFGQTEDEIIAISPIIGGT